MKKVLRFAAVCVVFAAATFLAAQYAPGVLNQRVQHEAVFTLPLTNVSVNADKPSTPPATQPGPAQPAKPGAPAQSAPSGHVTVKLSPQEEAALRQMQLDMLKIQYENAKMGLLMNRIQLQKSGIELELAKRAIMEMAAQDDINGVYTFSGPVTQSSVKTAMAELTKMARALPPTENGKPAPITIILNSPGGEVMAGLALYDHIRDLSRQGHHITVKVRGIAASMGGILLQAGDTRVIGENAMVLIHEVSGQAIGKVSEMSEQIALTDTLWNKLVDILVKRSTMKVNEIKDKAHKFDWWLDAKEAVKLGFADKVE